MLILQTTLDLHSSLIGIIPFAFKYDFAVVGTGDSLCEVPEIGILLLVVQPRAKQEEALVHEAAIGKIAGDQLIKLMTLGLTEAEAEERIIEGFLSN